MGDHLQWKQGGLGGGGRLLEDQHNRDAETVGTVVHPDQLKGRSRRGAFSLPQLSRPLRNQPRPTMGMLERPPPARA